VRSRRVCSQLTSATELYYVNVQNRGVSNVMSPAEFRQASVRYACPRPITFLLALTTLASACADRSPQPTPRLYVSNEHGGDVAIVDPTEGRVVERIPVGKRPRGVRVSHDGRHLLVALSGSPIAGPDVDESKLPPGDRSADGIGFVDVAARKVVRIFPSGQDPESFDLSPDGKTVYVSNEEIAEMSVLDLTSGAITGRVPVGEEPEGVTVRPGGTEVYVTCEGDNAVLAIDTKTLKVLGRMTTAARPRSVVFTKDGRTAFVAAETGGAVTILDATAHTVIGTIPITTRAAAPTRPRPMGTALSADARHVFVSTGRARSVAVIDIASRGVVRTIDDVGTRPWGIAVSPDGKELYTANGPSDDVSVIDITSGRISRRVHVSGSPWGIAVSP
jgi:PQQ-dependent catabolism-associated beta-propeller protein